MKRAISLAALTIAVYLLSDSLLLTLVCIAMSLRILVNRWIYIGIMMVFGLRLLNPNIPLLPYPNQIIELNKSSIIAMMDQHKVIIGVADVSIYDMHDSISISQLDPLSESIHLYGFDAETYYKANQIEYSAQESNLKVTHGNDLIHWISRGGFNHNPEFIKVLRSVFFQSDQSESTYIIISLGLIYSVMISLVSFFLDMVLKEKTRFFIIFTLLFGIAYMMVWPLSLMRVIIFYIMSFWIKDRNLRFYLNLLCLSLINPWALNSMVFLFPLGMAAVTLYFPSKYKWLYQSGLIMLMTTYFMQRINLIYGVLYPLIRIVYKGLIYLVALGIFLPVLTSILLWFFDSANPVMTFIMNVGVYHGAFSLLGSFSLLIILFIQTKIPDRSFVFVWLGYCLLCPLLILPWTYQMTMINVGQGDGILFQAPFNQETILIDTGNAFNYTNLSQTLYALGISTIDTLIITHGDSDHSGNILALQKDFNVKSIVLSPHDVTSDYFLLKNISPSINGLDVNQASLVYLTMINQTKVLLLGDIDTSIEENILAQYPDLEVDLAKLAHHGSKTSSSEHLFSQLKMRLALISVGKNNYGHPSYEVLERLKLFHTPYLSTLLDGDIQVLFTWPIRMIISHRKAYFF